jgi:hypothetical protein
MRYFALGAAAGLTLTTILGILMAYRLSRRPALVTFLLLAPASPCPPPSSSSRARKESSVYSFESGFLSHHLERRSCGMSGVAEAPGA